MSKSSPPQTSRRSKPWLCLVLVPLVALGALTLLVQTSSLLGGSTSGLRRSWRTRYLPRGEAVPDEDLLHLSLLHEVCTKDPNAPLPWQFGSPGHQVPGATANNSHVLLHQKDKHLLQKLRQCPDVDVFLPSREHRNGYCEDAAAYVKCTCYWLCRCHVDAHDVLWHGRPGVSTVA